MGRLIYEDDIRKVVEKYLDADDSNGSDVAMDILSDISGLPPVQPEEAIPIVWLEQKAKWFEKMDNAFAKIEANNIRVMIKQWREQE